MAKEIKQEKKKSNARSLHWLITFNNISHYTEDQVKEFVQAKISEGLIKYFIIAKEEAPSTKKVHYHAIASFSSLKSPKQLQDLFPGAHIDLVSGGKSCLIKALQYVIKEGAIIYEHGTRPLAPSSRGPTMQQQFEEAVKKIKSGKWTKEDEESYVYCKNQRFIDQLILKYTKPTISNVDLQRKNIWLYGKPRTGKSSMVWNYCIKNDITVYNKLQNRWWDGYRGQQFVIIEDADLDKIKMIASNIKVWSDRFEFTAEIKGSSTAIEPIFNFIITSNYSISQCFNEVDASAIKERFSEVYIDASYPVVPGAQYTQEQLELIYFGDGESLYDDSIKAKLFQQFIKPQSFELNEEEATTLVVEPEDVSIDLEKPDWQWHTLPTEHSHHFDEEKEVEEPPRSQAPPPPSPPQRTKTRELPPTPSIDPSIQIEEDLRRWDAMFFPEMAQKTPSKEDK